MVAVYVGEHLRGSFSYEDWLVWRHLTGAGVQLQTDRRFYYNRDVRPSSDNDQISCHWCTLEVLTMPWRDVFDSDLRLPTQVCIVAPGPNGVGHYDEIPTGFFVIALSKAVLLRGLRPSVWMMNHVDQPWYEEANSCFAGTRVFKQDAALATAAGNAEGGGYFFTPPDEPLGLEEWMPVDGCIRIGATISACAVQFAYNFGAQEIVLCGVDMSGDGYYDGTINRNPNHGETWPATARLNLLIDWLTAHRGLQFTTISPTKLNVPLRGERSRSPVPASDSR